MKRFLVGRCLHCLNFANGVTTREVNAQSQSIFHEDVAFVSVDFLVWKYVDRAVFEDCKLVGKEVGSPTISLLCRVCSACPWRFFFWFETKIDFYTFSSEWIINFIRLTAYM